jgi:hypothetical protein
VTQPAGTVTDLLRLREDAELDGDAFGDFLAAQPDLGTKSAPRYRRLDIAQPQRLERALPHS